MAERGTEVKKNKKSQVILVKGTYFDYPLFFLVIFLVGFGLLMVYSSSFYEGRIKYGNSSFFFTRQLVFAGAGFIAMMIISVIRYQFLQKLVHIGLIVGAAFMILLRVKGISKNGSTRWLEVFGIRFQPSEFVKIILIIYVAYLFTKYSGMLRKFTDELKILIVPGIFVVLIAIENLSSAIICFSIIAVMWFVATPKPLKVIILGAIGMAGLVGSIFLVGYRSDRIDAWLHPETAKNGFQVMQSLYAIGNGGIFGRGLGGSIQKMGSVPEAYNDMIFSIICEELGIVGAAAIIIVFIMLLWRIRFIAESAPDRFGSFICVGVIAHIGVQVLVNIGVVTNTIPNTGVTLPFISYGGTSLMLLLAEMGVIFSITRQIRPYRPKVGEQ